MQEKKIILSITPQTAVRANQSDRVFFRIPLEELRPAGLKRRLRLERYNNYKVSLLALAKQARFSLPEQGASILFYIPVPRTWRKWQKEQMHMTLHQSKPDLDNLAKAFFDSLLAEDKHIADIRLTKKWVNAENGWIEIKTTIPTLRSSDVLV
jgi:Holliday junction resolvase RusA-like endonuclease